MVISCHTSCIKDCVNFFLSINVVGDGIAQDGCFGNATGLLVTTSVLVGSEGDAGGVSEMADCASVLGAAASVMVNEILAH